MKISHLRDERQKDCFSRNFVLSGRYIDENISNDEIYSIIKDKENFKKLVFDFDNLSDIEFFKLYKDFYSGNELVKAVDFDSAFLSVKALADKDTMEVGVVGNDERVILVSLFDNLGKGASGAAIQNFNIITGQKETEGLTL